MKQYKPEDLCPGCQHPLARHDFDGCMVGWKYGPEGTATSEGCVCNLMLADGVIR